MIYDEVSDVTDFDCQEEKKDPLIMKETRR